MYVAWWIAETDWIGSTVPRSGTDLSDHNRTDRWIRVERIESADPCIFPDSILSSSPSNNYGAKWTKPKTRLLCGETVIATGSETGGKRGNVANETRRGESRCSD